MAAPSVGEGQPRPFFSHVAPLGNATSVGAVVPSNDPASPALALSEPAQNDIRHQGQEGHPEQPTQNNEAGLRQVDLPNIRPVFKMKRTGQTGHPFQPASHASMQTLPGNLSFGSHPSIDSSSSQVRSPSPPSLFTVAYPPISHPRSFAHFNSKTNSKTQGTSPQAVNLGLPTPAQLMRHFSAGSASTVNGVESELSNHLATVTNLNVPSSSSMGPQGAEITNQVEISDAGDVEMADSEMSDSSGDDAPGESREYDSLVNHKSHLAEESESDGLEESEDDEMTTEPLPEMSPVRSDLPAATVASLEATGELQKNLKMATSFRPYTKWIDSKAGLIPASGALIPDNYQKSSIPGFPWVCPIRSCRVAFPTLLSLGHHFVKGHRRGLFNDNGDGTLSLVLLYGGKALGKERGGPLPARIISRKPLNPMEPAMVAAAPHPKFVALSRPNAAEFSIPSKRNAEATASSPIAPSPPGPVSTQVADMWKHVRSYLTVHTGEIPSKGYVRELLSLPPVRELQWNTERAKTKPYRDRLPRDISALIMQLTGELAPSPCTRCAEGKGPFVGCIMISSAADSLARSRVFACANCFYQCNQTYCSHNASSVNWTGVPANGEHQSIPGADIASHPGRKAKHESEVIDESSAEDESASEEDQGITRHDEALMVAGEEIQGSIDLAEPGRPYKMWRDSHGKTMSTHGALIPKHYKLHDNPEYPWICAVRSCRTMLSSLHGLGIHFINVHRAAKLHDNMDGTFSLRGTWASTQTRANIPGKPIVGSRPPLVISKGPLRPEDQALAEPTPSYRVMREIETLSRTKSDRAMATTTPLGRTSERLPSSRSKIITLKVPKMAITSPLSGASDGESHYDGSEVDGTEADESEADDESKMELDATSENERPIDAHKEAGGATMSQDNSPERNLSNIELAEPGRPYTMCRNDSGDLIPTHGALIPKGYTFDATITGRPWICPVRTCRWCYKTRHDLSCHFMRVYYGCLFNDNGDGTLSIVDKYAEKPFHVSRYRYGKGAEHGAPPLVVSQNPLDPSEPPMPSGSLPAYLLLGQSAPTKSGRKKRGSRAGLSTTLRAGTIQRDELPASTTAYSGLAGKGNPEQLWRAIKPFITTQQPPKNGWIPQLLVLPQRRAVQFNPARTAKKFFETHNRDIAALLIQVTGDSPSNPCERCRNGKGVFHGCYVASANTALEVRANVTSCANCYYKGQQVACSLAARLPRVGRGRRSVNSLYGVDFPNSSKASKAPSVTERSRLVSEEADDEEEEYEDDETANNEATTGTGQPILSIARTRQTRSTATLVQSQAIHKAPGRSSVPFTTPGHPSLISAGVPPAQVQITQDNLEMEDWELAPGRLQSSAAGGGAIAFSKAFLSGSNAIRMTEDVSVRVQTVHSGETVRFDAESDKTRLCLLAAGKVRVCFDAGGHGGGASSTTAEDEFSIGSHGTFTIGPSRACSVQNRLYVDVLLHVISVAL